MVYSSCQYTASLLLSVPKSSFLMRENVACSLETKVQILEEEWRGTRSKMLEVHFEGFSVCADLGSHVIGWCWSTVLY